MRNPTEQSTANNHLTFDEIRKIFAKPITLENITPFFSQGFPPVLLEADHFIDLLKRRALWDEAGACRMIDFAAPHLSTIIHNQHAFRLFYSTLSQTVLSHLFSKVDFIPNRFFANFAAARTWLLDNSYSREHRLFLFKFYQQHFINMLQSQPFTVGILSTLLSFFSNLTEQDPNYIKEIMRFIKPKIINLFGEQNILPSLRYALLSVITNEEFTLLIREMPESFKLLCNMIDPTFFPLIQFEKLPLDQKALIQMQLIQNLIHYYNEQKEYSAFFTVTYHAKDMQFITELKKIIDQPEKNNIEKISEIQKLIDQDYPLLSTYLKKLLHERQLTAGTLTYGIKSSSFL